MNRKLLIAGLLVSLATIGSACVFVGTSFKVGALRYFSGEIRNTTGANILGHNVEVTFLDANNNILGVTTIKGCLRSAQGGSSQFFDAPTTHTAARKVIAKIKLDSEFLIGTAASGNVTVSNIVAMRSGTDLTVTGTVENNDATELESIRVCAVVRDSGDDVIRVAPDDDVLDLEQDDTDTFSITLKVPDDTTADSVDIWVDGFANGVMIKPISQLNTNVTQPTPTPTATTTGTPEPTATATATPAP